VRQTHRTHRTQGIIFADVASTVQYINMESSVWHNPDASERMDSDCESDPERAGSEPDQFCRDIAYASDTAVFNKATSLSAGKCIYYEGTGLVIGDVDGFEHEYSNLCDDPLAQFNSEQGFKLAPWFMQGKVSKSRINQEFSSGLGDAESVGYSSMHTLANHLRLLDLYSQYLRWFKGLVEDGQRTLPCFYPNVVGCVRDLLRPIV